MSQIPEPVDHFIGSLEDLEKADDRAALAALRRGLSKEPGTAAEMYPVVVPRLPFGLSPRQEDWYYFIAALFAAHPEPGGQGNLGKAFAHLKAAKNSESVEKRFVALLNSHEDDLPGHLRHAASLLQSRNVPVDWRQLLYDVQYWGHPDRFVQRRWARDFWAVAQPVGEQAPEPVFVSPLQERS
jgi:CRISPR system Cascade subunit CasB